MPLYQLLTDRTLAQASAITPTTLIHIVTTGDTSQNSAGSSYKAELGQLVGLFSGGSVSGEYLPLSGGTVTGSTSFTNGLTANTISATTYQNLPTDVRVTGGTYSAGTITFTNNTGGTFNVTGLTTGSTSTISGDYLPLSGGTVTGTTTFTNGLTANTISATTIGNSGDCVDDLYVTNIHSCSPLNINPLNEGNVYFGSTSGVSIDLANTRFGIGTSTPQFPFQIVGANSIFYYDPTSVGGRFNVSGNTNIPRYDVSIGAYLTRPATGGSVGMRSWNDVVYVGYGKVGDMHIYAGNEAYGLNIINGPGTNTEDYIRFYAGTDATSTSDIHIQGTGTTRGFVGLGIENPTAKLHVFGSTIVTGTLTATTVSATTSTITTSTSNNLIVSNPYVPTGSTDPTGVVGTISWSGNSIYLRNSTEWVRFTGETSW